MPRPRVCLDASLVVALLIPERFSVLTLRLWEQWMIDDVVTMAPFLMRYEVTNAIYRNSIQNQITADDARASLVKFQALMIEWIDAPGLSIRMAELAEQFHRLNIYDACYLVTAEHLGCLLWTADERLYNAVSSRFDGIRWIGHYQPGSEP